jgi:hypothetical protein
MDPRIAEWLASWDTGTSSKSIMLWLSSKTADKTWGASTPSDCADLARCLRLLERIPEWKQRMGEMAETGGEWPTYAKRWAEIEASFLAEVGKLPARDDRDWKAPKTYELMKRVQAEARQAANTASQYVPFGENCKVRVPAGAWGDAVKAAMKART